MANILDSFFRREKTAGPTGGEKALSVTLEPGGFVTEVRTIANLPRPRTDTASLQETQIRNELVFACIDTKATAAQDPRLVVQQAVTRKGKTEYEEVPGHPMRQLMMRPNPDMTEADLYRAAMVSWDVSNPRRFYCERVETGGLLTELWPLNPAQMQPKLSRDRRELIGYTWSDGINKREFSLDELLIRTAPAWYNPPPLPAALGAEASDTAQTNYVAAFFTNGGIPSGFLKYKDMVLNDPKREEIRAKWRGTYGNSYGRQFDIGVLDANVDYQETGSKLDEIASQTLRSIAESRICMVFKVPPLIVYAYVGLLRATYSNLGEAWSNFWDATMSPAFKEWRVFWQWSLLTEFEEERDIKRELVRLFYDMSNVPALQEDVDAIQKRARENFSAGGISFNEYRQAIGEEPVPGGDDLYVAKPMTTIAGMTAIAPETAPKGRRRKDRTSPGAQVIERQIEKAIKAYLLTQYGKGGLSGLDDGAGVAKVMGKFYPLLLEYAWGDAKDDGVGISWDLSNPYVQETLERLADDIKGVADTTKDEIRALVGRQADEGWSAEELAKQIQALGETRSPTRAITIARTETGTAYNLGAVSAYKAGGITHVTVLDGEDDEPCASANGATWTLAEAEANPLGHPNCVRAFSPIVE